MQGISSATLKVVLLGDSGVGKTCMRSQFVHRIFSNGYKATIGGDYLTSRVRVETVDSDRYEPQKETGKDTELGGAIDKDTEIQTTQAGVQAPRKPDEAQTKIQSVSEISIEAQSDKGTTPTTTPTTTKAKDAFASLQIWDTAGQERFNSITQAFYRGTDVVVLVYDITNYESVVSLKHWFQKFLEHCQVSNPGVVIVGNKADKANERVVDVEEIREILTLNNEQFDQFVDWDKNVFEICSRKFEEVQRVFERVAQVGMEGEIRGDRNVQQFDGLELEVGKSCCT